MVTYHQDRRVSMKREVVETDVLCVGGGIAGLMAAIRASELGAKVIIAEKGNALCSGTARCGNDHFWCYIPEVHGSDLEAFLDDVMATQMRSPAGRDIIRTWAERTFEIVKLWDKWGIPMKYKGRWEFAGHRFPGRRGIALKYGGLKQKDVLTNEALKRGTEIINRVMVFDLFGNSDSVIGAIGIHTQEDKIIVFKAKSIFIGTGQTARLYPGITPGWFQNINQPITLTGDGRAMTYRAGAELTNLEFPKHWAGPRYFARAGKGTWVGVLRDPHDKPVGPFVTKPDKRYGDPASDVYQRVFQDYMESGKGPIYMDCRGISDEDLEYMTYWLKHEENTALLDYMKEEGIDFQKNPVEFGTYESTQAGGIYCNNKSETSVKGLYAGGDEFTAGVSYAAVYGWIGGENAARYAKEASTPSLKQEKSMIEEKISLFEEIVSRKDGAEWKEANIALQQIMFDYAGANRSETLLEAGLGYLRRLKEKVYATIMARNQHDLGRCLEVLNLLELGELIFIAANERKETRGFHKRVDYPYVNPLMDKLLIVRKADEKPVTEWRDRNK